MKWFEELQTRYFSIRPDIKTQDEFNRLTPMEKSYFTDMQRLIDEVKQLTNRMDDFRYVFSKIPSHPLLTKVMAGALKPEDKLEEVSGGN